MDKRLPHRVKEVRQEFLAAGRRCDSEAVREELCKRFPEYGRIKQQPLKRIIAQELSTPAPPQPAPAGPQPPAAPAAPSSGGDANGGKKRKRGSGAPEEQEDASQNGAEAKVAKEAAEVEPAEPDPSTSLNGSLRKMYNPTAKPLAQPAPQRQAGAGAAGRRGQLSAQERAARAVARREHGLSASDSTGGFAPEERPEERLEDLGGIDSILADLRQLIVQPLAHPEVFAHLGVHPPTGVLLHGPPGSGKTKLAHAIAGTTGVAFFKVAATEIVSGMSGESEAKIRQLFQAAIAAAPALLFLDEVDAITPKRDSAGREMERRIVAQMLTCMDDLRNTNVIVMGATNRPDALDPALRRAGRFDREIAMGIPDEGARARILETMAKGMRLAEDLDVPLLARLTPGFVGADLSALTKEAALSAVGRAFQDLNANRQASAEEQGDTEAPYTTEEMSCLAVEMKDFHDALTRVQPSARREGFTTIPNVSWEDIGALAEVRTDLDAAICEPIRKAALFKQFGLTVPVGVLLFGPPGCGKTLLAKAVANASGANFIAIKGPELLNKYVGESERAVRLVFQRATASSPCVIFFDELDALVPRRSSEGNSSSERVVNQMLTEMDGVGERSQVYVIAATNRPDIVDPAMLRPGRLDRLIFVPLPSEMGRLEILQAHMRKLPLSNDVDLPALARSCDGFSGADLASLSREAAMLAIRGAPAPPPAGTPEAAAAAEEAASSIRITAELLSKARSRVSSSVGAEERKDYEALA
eukprot:CAMPEP_0115392608 /NCGR_PEP_ID=MMETSP0271-20121206/11309_1 /TAXON_ID=71861 /ORGANISM="Scrippsiella trochoidea, Strain CCMP3099" /LENGTH=758 /DNA_ID=CAMNT_0002816195 /DNA_START=59 /DNA_END=2333 /DNA_ORIENTATION=-